jgi:glycosyltransferase involved in cell wall biosynthesis
MMLLHFLRWLRENSDLDFHVLLNQDGELARDFAEVAPVVSVQGDPPGAWAPLRLLRRVGWADQALNPPPSDVPAIERAIRVPARRVVVALLERQLRQLGALGLVYLNSVQSAPALSLIGNDVPVLTHSHELEPVLEELRRTSPGAIEAMLARTTRYVAASEAAARALSGRLAVDPGQVSVCHEFIPLPQGPVDAGELERARAELGLGPDTLLVGSVGTIGWRKAPDVFLLVAKRVLELAAGHREVRFVWIGDPPAYDTWSLPQVMHDLHSLGLSASVRFIGSRADPSPYMTLFDVFALPSRSDPYPLVCLEAAALGKPIVCFEAGGMEEFLAPDERLVLPYLDIEAMADRIWELLNASRERTDLGGRLAARVRDRHRVDVAAPRLLEEIRRTVRA